MGSAMTDAHPSVNHWKNSSRSQEPAAECIRRRRFSSVTTNRAKTLRRRHFSLQRIPWIQSHHKQVSPQLLFRKAVLMVRFGFPGCYLGAVVQSSLNEKSAGGASSQTGRLRGPALCRRYPTFTRTAARRWQWPASVSDLLIADEEFLELMSLKSNFGSAESWPLQVEGHDSQVVPPRVGLDPRSHLRAWAKRSQGPFRKQGFFNYFPFLWINRIFI